MTKLKLLFAFACTFLLGEPARAAQHFVYCEVPNPCTIYGGTINDGTIPDDGRSYIFRAEVTAGVPVYISGLSEVQTYTYYRDRLGVPDVTWNVPYTYTGPTLNRSLSDANWSVYDWFFKPGVLPFDNCDQPGPTDVPCARHTTWYWNGMSIYSTRSYDEEFVVALELIAVPEPSSWALMIAGFAAIGFSLRRRQAAKFNNLHIA